MALQKKKYTYVDFRDEPGVPIFAKATNAIATAADNQEDYFRVNGHYFEWIQTGASTALMPTVAATGWTLPIDNTDGEGLEITQGMLANQAPMRFTTGTDAFFIEFVLYVGTVTTQDVIGGGFRELGAYTDITTPALMNSVYDSKLAVYTNDNAGTLQCTSSVNNVDTQTALAHAAIAPATWMAVRVAVTAARAGTIQIGTSLASAAAAKAALAADANQAAVTVENAQTWVPYLVVVNTGAIGVSDVQLVTYECGLL